MIIICCLPGLPVEISWPLLTPLQRFICAYTTTRDGPPQLAAVLGQEPSDWSRWCALLCCMSRASLDGKWPDTQFHLTKKRIEPAGMEPLGYERHRWESRRPSERERRSQLRFRDGAAGFIDWLDLF